MNNRLIDVVRRELSRHYDTPVTYAQSRLEVANLLRKHGQGGLDDKCECLVANLEVATSLDLKTLATKLEV